MVGLLSLEWLHDHIHGNAGVISSARTKGNGKVIVFVGFGGKKKSGNLLCNSVYSLKNVSKLRGKDRRDVLKVLKRVLIKRMRASEGNDNKESISGEAYQSSVNNSWKRLRIFGALERRLLLSLMEIRKICLMSMLGHVERVWGGSER